MCCIFIYLLEAENGDGTFDLSGHFCACFPMKEAVREEQIEMSGLRTQQCLCSVTQTVCVYQMFNLGSASRCPLRRHTQNITRGRFWEEQLKLVSTNWNRVHWKQSIRRCLFPLGNETGSSVKLSALCSVRSQARVDDWSYNSGNSETEAGGIASSKSAWVAEWV